VTTCVCQLDWTIGEELGRKIFLQVSTQFVTQKRIKLMSFAYFLWNFFKFHQLSFSHDLESWIHLA